MQDLTVQFLLCLEELEVDDLVFLDESGINIQMARNYGYAPVGQRLFAFKSGQYAKNYTVLGALTAEGMGALMTVNGGTSIEVFHAFVEQVLLPTLRPGQTVVMDNLAAHKHPSIKKLLSEHGVDVLYTPPYSPQWNPIELAWSKIKTYLRSFAARSLEALQSALVDAADLVTPTDAIHWIQSCGHTVVDI